MANNLQLQISPPGFLRSGACPIQSPHALGLALFKNITGCTFCQTGQSLIGEWEEEAIDRLEAAFPSIIKELEAKLLTRELDAQRQQRITVHHNGFTCEADSLGSHGYVYVVLYPAITL